LVISLSHLCSTLLESVLLSGLKIEILLVWEHGLVAGRILDGLY